MSKSETYEFFEALISTASDKHLQAQAWSLQTRIDEGHANQSVRDLFDIVVAEIADRDEKADSL